MGVSGLWNILEPVGRPVKLETLRDKRLAIDASIWIYHFVKAVRDSDGNQLRYSHLIGFFRRIVKLLFFQIKPVFVFDGRAPELKRRTLAARKARRENKLEDSARSATRLLALQLHRKRLFEEENTSTTSREKKQKSSNIRPDFFRKQDPYHLQEMSFDWSEITKSDPRFLNGKMEEQIFAGLKSNPTGIEDYSSPIFAKLPLEEQYKILNDARRQSRLRLGYDKSYFKKQFDDPLEFSKFQIERLKKRNELTTRLMTLNNEEELQVNRIASNQNREYILLKDSNQLEGLVQKAKPKQPSEEVVDKDDDDVFEDIPLHDSESSSIASVLDKPLSLDIIEFDRQEKPYLAHKAPSRADISATQEKHDTTFPPKNNRKTRFEATPKLNTHDKELKPATVNLKTQQPIMQTAYTQQNYDSTEGIKSETERVNEEIVNLNKSPLIISASKNDFNGHEIDANLDLPSVGAYKYDELILTSDQHEHIQSDEYTTTDIPDSTVSDHDDLLLQKNVDLKLASLPSELNTGEDHDTITIKDETLIPSSSSESDEEERLQNSLMDEEIEYKRFLQSELMKTESLSDSNALNLKELVEMNIKSARDQQRRERRDADAVTDNMIQDCQELLKLFGIPFVTAPMEAEAQCSQLLKLKLVDGIVTDDSDVFLFGGERVYKNVFNQSKYVECYLSSDIEHMLGLDQKSLINLAKLLGSDYTEGISHIGPVKALEILSEFPGKDGLNDFARWFRQHLRRLASGEKEDLTPTKKWLSKLTTKISLPHDFLDPEIDMAYLKPEVDASTEPFEWAKPNLDGIRQYLMSTIGWTLDRCNEVLLPLIRNINADRSYGVQKGIQNYYLPKETASTSNRTDNNMKFKSSRMLAAVQRYKLANKPS